MTMNSRSFEFRHRPLLANEIRLCRVRQDISATGLLQLELRHFLQEPEPTVTRRFMQLENAPEYTALSYTWGSEVPLHEIFINGASIAVRENLFMFLSTAYELSEHTSWFWIDQLCIDQSNTIEKNHVVRDMKSIYSRAIGVRVWLGARNAQTDIAFGVLKEFEILRQLYYAEISSNPESETDPAQFNALILGPDEARKARFVDNQYVSSALAELLARPYWRR